MSSHRRFQTNAYKDVLLVCRLQSPSGAPSVTHESAPAMT